MGPVASTHPFLAGKRLVLCLGPGGVGKTTCAAALSLAAARAGRKVAVITIDPSRRLAEALGLDRDSGRDEPVLVESCPSGGSLHASVLDPQVVFDRIVREAAESPEQAEQIVENPIYQATVRHLGGALEYAAVAKVQRLAAGPYDLVVLDTPPCVNARDFLRAPDRISEIARNPAARVLGASGRVGGRIFGNFGAGAFARVLGSMGGVGFLRQLGAFLRNFSSVIAAFERRADAFERILRSPATATYVVTSPLAFAVKETLAFVGELDALRISVDAVVLNRVEPSPPPSPSREALSAWLSGEPDAPSPEEVAHLRDALAREASLASRAERAIAAVHPRLAVVSVVRSDEPPSARTALADLGERLGRRLGAQAAS
ncbi:MAG: hypothetical protein D6705_10890 [Deltaproteobacteria bacterium]|nr:MAG: hypothetical protein D6705_10890 [Deltaproteobacteria bacterium]